jgi:hypothetical protein
MLSFAQRKAVWSSKQNPRSRFMAGAASQASPLSLLPSETHGALAHQVPGIFAANLLERCNLISFRGFLVAVVGHSRSSGVCVARYFSRGSGSNAGSSSWYWGFFLSLLTVMNPTASNPGHVHGWRSGFSRRSCESAHLFRNVEVSSGKWYEIGYGGTESG